MEYNQLRIGNKVNYRDEVKTISAMNKSSVCFEEDEDRYFKLMGVEPLPLTEEWLIRMGFELLHKGNQHYFINDPNGYKDSYKIHVFKTINDKWHIGFSDNLAGKDRDYSGATKFEFVHQLQNLYFALTNNELTISYGVENNKGV